MVTKPTEEKVTATACPPNEWCGKDVGSLGKKKKKGLNIRKNMLDNLQENMLKKKKITGFRVWSGLLY